MWNPDISIRRVSFIDMETFGVTNLHRNGENTNRSESLVILEVTYLVCCSYSKSVGWWRDDGEASMGEIVVVQRSSRSPPPHPLGFLFVFSSPSCISLLSVSLYLARALAYVSNHFLPAPPTPSLSSPSSQISPISLSFPQLLLRPLPV